ncbi:hypothetical protein IscW_ISCW003192 [Ixodes scapularis]|uniref:Uncharacterized protein n=1 Tax=Ixodes scapularis TaxID=6945 RepID=B7P8Q0_IXOSC|nr:hypothetical protein IscW_ISCW003192 [Ixodes scapularis]|eukprot:XP_002402541.1 hypothetical protein IscW_ISCW003192 [Ixodes scapularis]
MSFESLPYITWNVHIPKFRRARKNIAMCDLRCCFKNRNSASVFIEVVDGCVFSCQTVCGAASSWLCTYYAQVYNCLGMGLNGCGSCAFRLGFRSKCWGI